jgi:uncharacterized protein YecE (DUF72 family)
MTATAMTVAGLQVGTSGWSYAGWKPGFYPADARPDEFLGFYAGRFPSVELNSTGYRLPAEEQFDRWAAATPEGFTFAVKMPARGFRDTATFEERVRRLRSRLGPIRAVVAHPRDDGLLELFLGSASLRYAFDLRDPSWDDADVDARLAEAGAVRVGALEAPVPFRYLRFRDPPYDEEALAGHAAAIRPLLDSGVEVYAYYRHEDEPTAPRYAERLTQLLA